MGLAPTCTDTPGLEVGGFGGHGFLLLLSGTGGTLTDAGVRARALW